MKGKWQRITKKIFAGVLTLAVAITAVNLSPLTAKAATGEFVPTTTVQALTPTVTNNKNGTVSVVMPTLASTTGLNNDTLSYLFDSTDVDYTADFDGQTVGSDDNGWSPDSKYFQNTSSATITINISDFVTEHPTTAKELCMMIISDKKYSQGGHFYVYGYASYTLPQKVIYDANGGSGAPGTEWLVSTDTNHLSTIPTNTGKVFTGWYTAATGGAAVTTTDAVIAAGTVYAQWREPKTYTITARSDNDIKGTVSGGGPVTEGNETTVTAKANKGYHFVNWTENDTVVSSEPAYTFTPEDSRTLTAVFSDGDAVNVIGNVQKFISVDITWGSMAYQYDYKGKTWSIGDDANKLSITNHSNVAINAGLNFTGKTTNDSTIVTENISADFRDAATSGSAVTGYDIPVGWGIEGGKTENAWLNLTGGAIKGAGDIGMITVTITNKDAL